MPTFISYCFLVTMCINSSKYMSSSSQIWFFVFASVSVPINMIKCVNTMTSMLLKTFTYDRQHFSPCSLCASYWDGSISCMDVVSSFYACCASCCTCSFYASFSHLCSSCSSLSFCFNSYNCFSISLSTFA